MTDNEIFEIKEVIGEHVQLSKEVDQLEIKISQIKERKNEILNELGSIRDKDFKIYKRMVDKYGKNVVDLKLKEIMGEYGKKQ